MGATNPLTHGLPVDAKYVIDGDGHAWVLENWEPNNWAYLSASEVHLYRGRVTRYRDLVEYQAHPRLSVSELPNPSVEIDTASVMLYLMANTLSAIQDHVSRPWRN